MKNEMNEKLTSAKKFVQTHKTKIALAIGVTAGVSATLAVKHQLDKDKDKLIVDAASAAKMRLGAFGVYETQFGTVMTIMNDEIRDTLRSRD